MISKTISITIPEQLEVKLQNCANEIGISRSRFICNILLEWQKNQESGPNNCANLKEGWCEEFAMFCKAPQKEAETCSGFKNKG